MFAFAHTAHQSICLICSGSGMLHVGGAQRANRCYYWKPIKKVQGHLHWVCTDFGWPVKASLKIIYQFWRSTSPFWSFPGHMVYFRDGCNSKRMTEYFSETTGIRYFNVTFNTSNYNTVCSEMSCIKIRFKQGCFRWHTPYSVICIRKKQLS